MDEKIVEIKNLDKSFDGGKTFAIKSLNVDISSGKIIGLLGTDGAGKTTLLRLIAGLLKPSLGFIKILNNDTISDANNIFQLISYMPQKFGLYEDLTVLQNLNLYGNLQGLSNEEKKEKFEKLLQFTDLKNFTNRLAGKLSGGMKQKLGLACTLIRKPKLLLLDEPSVGVDPISRRELWKIVSKLVEENISILWSTSYLDEAEKCQDVLILNEGKLLYFGPSKNLTDKLNNRSFQIQNITTDRRHVLNNAIATNKLVDGVVQGSAVRVILKKEDEKFDVAGLNAGKEAVLVSVAPRFEDAFMDILGGIPVSKSPLAKENGSFEKDESHIVEVQSLTKCFGNFTAADQISFSVKKGEIFGLLGPNGAGKSTTFKMLCGLIAPTKGDAIISGLSIKNVTSKARAKIGYMAQKFSLYNNMSVLQNLNFFSGIYAMDPVKRKNNIDLMISIFNLSSFVNTTTFELPLGFKQRLALSCAIMHSPKVLFLDEPTSGVDPITRREFWSHINALVDKGISVIITTHFMDEAEYCDTIGLINQGKLLVVDSPDNLKKSVRSKDLPEPTLEDAFIIISSKNKKMGYEEK